MVSVWNRLTLLQRFTFASAVIAIALAVVLSVVTVRAIESFAVKDEAQVAAELVLRAIAPQLRPGDFSGPLAAERRVLLDSLFRAHGISDRALRIRLWRGQGDLLYSNVPEPEGLRIAGAELAGAQGYAAFFEAHRRLEATAPNVVRFFVPVQVEGDPTPLGAFEIFYDLTDLYQQLAYVRRAVWTAVPAGIAILYASVFVLVRRASRRLLKQQADLVAAHLGTYQALASAIDAKDSYTGDHSSRVAELAVQIARRVGLPEHMMDEVRMGARLHDLGKIGVPDRILMKPGPLDPDEMAQMRTHAEGGYQILNRAPLAEGVKLAVRHSHERWDGQGYPEGRSGDHIPLLARIVSVVDAFEAMTSDRPYRKALPVEEALRRLEQGAGTQFDARVVEVFVALMRQVEAGSPSEARAQHQQDAAQPRGFLPQPGR